MKIFACALMLLASAGALTTLRSFRSYGPGASPIIDDVAKDSDGNIYGATDTGGWHGKGAIFRIRTKN